MGKHLLEFTIYAQRQAELERQRQEDLERQRQAEEERQRQAELERQRQAEVERQRQAELERQRQAEVERQRQAELEKQRQAASNTPVSISAGRANASWRNKPRPEFPQRALRNARPGDSFTVTLRMEVDKQGSITNVSIASSSGNSIIDNDAVTTFKRGRFNPFMENGVAVVGIVTLPVTYEVPSR